MANAPLKAPSGLNGFIMRVLLCIYVLRMMPVMQLALKGQIAARRLGQVMDKRAMVAPPSTPPPTVSELIGPAGEMAHELASLRDVPWLVELLAQDERGAVVVSVTAEYVAVSRVTPWLARRTVFNCSASRWQLEVVELPTEGGAPPSAPPKAPPAVAAPPAPSIAAPPSPGPAAAAAAPSDGDGAAGGAAANASDADSASASGARQLVRAAELVEHPPAPPPAPPPPPEYLDTVLRLKNFRTKKSHLILMPNAEAARLRALHRRAVVRRQVIQIDRDVRRTQLGRGGLQARIVREVLVAYALQAPLAERYVQGNHLLAVALTQAFFGSGVLEGAPGLLPEGAAAGVVGGAAGSEPAAAAEPPPAGWAAAGTSPSAYPHLDGSHLEQLRACFVSAGLFPDSGPTARQLGRLAASAGGAAEAEAWAAAQVLGAFKYVMVTQGLAALCPGGSDAAFGVAGGGVAAPSPACVRALLSAMLARTQGPLARALATPAAEPAVADADSGAAGGAPAHAHGDGGDGGCDGCAQPAPGAAAAAAAETAAAAAAGGAEAASAGAPATVDAGAGTDAPAGAGMQFGPIAAAVLELLEPLSLASLLTIPPAPPASATAAMGAVELGAGAAGCAVAYPTTAEQDHFVAVWRAFLAADGAPSARSLLLKLVGARALGYCQEESGARSWYSPPDSWLLHKAGIFDLDWSAALDEAASASEAGAGSSTSGGAAGSKLGGAPRPGQSSALAGPAARAAGGAARAASDEQLGDLSARFASGWKVSRLEMALLRTRLATTNKKRVAAPAA